MMQESQAIGISGEAAAPPSEVAAAAIRNSAAVLGDISWLMMESTWHRGRKVEDFARLILPPIKLRQFRLFHKGHVPIAFVSWALLSPEAERKYLADPYSLSPEDWTSGKAIYLVDFVASIGTVRRIAPYLRRDPLIATGPVRGLKNRNGHRLLVEVFTNAAGIHTTVDRLDH